MTTPEANSKFIDLLNLGNYIEGDKRSSQGDSISISKECPYLGAARLIDKDRQTCAEHTKRNLRKAPQTAVYPFLENADDSPRIRLNSETRHLASITQV
jgi:hypothetical protein